MGQTKQWTLYEDSAMIPDASANGIEQFKQQVLPLREAYSHAGLSYHAVLDGSCRVILHARLFLQARPTGIPRKVVRFLDQEVGYYDLSELRLGAIEVIERFFRGEPLDTSEGQILFPLNPDAPAQSQFHPIHEASPSNSRMAVLTLTGAEFKKSRFSNELDWELKANDPPYDNLRELLIEFRLNRYSGDFSCIEIPVHHLAEVDLGSKVSGKVAEPGVMLSLGVDRTHLSLGVIVHHQGTVVERLVLSGGQLTWTERDTPAMPMHQYGRAEVAIPAGAALKCFAAYKGLVQNEGWIGDPGTWPNLRRTAYEWADNGCEALRDFLFADGKPRKDSRDFEVGVASLLWMLGFGILQLRTGRLQDNPDLLLTTPQGRMALIECTTDVIDKEDKLAKLHARTKSMREQLQKSDLGHVDLLPVLVTALPTAAVMDIEKATKFGILVLTKEGLQSALNRSIIPQDADALFLEQIQLLQIKKNI